MTSARSAAPVSASSSIAPAHMLIPRPWLGGRSLSSRISTRSISWLCITRASRESSAMPSSRPRQQLRPAVPVHRRQHRSRRGREVGRRPASTRRTDPAAAGQTPPALTQPGAPATRSRSPAPNPAARHKPAPSRPASSTVSVSGSANGDWRNRQKPLRTNREP